MTQWMLTLILTSLSPESPQSSALRHGPAFFIPCWTATHTFDGKERPEYLASLVSVTEHCGTLYVLCFSNEGADAGPHPIRQEELTAPFNARNGWNVAAIKSERIQTRIHDDGAPGWLVRINCI
jgi:hypothetical protein